MGRVLVVFGSKSNKKVYDRVCAELKRLNADFDLRVCSAHKTPVFLDKILEKKYSVIIAGAGLAAHLAGVIASKTTAPVIGVPCNDNLGGLDSLLSTLQMPPGIPVLCVGVDRAEDAASAAVKIMNAPEKVSVIIKNSYAEKAADMLLKLNVPYELSYELETDMINIRFIDLKDIKKADEGNALIINCPISENPASESNALRLLEIGSGLWVGINRAENAAIASAEILGKEKELLDYRKEIASAVIDADKEENKKC